MRALCGRAGAWLWVIAFFLLASLPVSGNKGRHGAKQERSNWEQLIGPYDWGHSLGHGDRGTLFRQDAIAVNITNSGILTVYFVFSTALCLLSINTFWFYRSDIQVEERDHWAGRALAAHFLCRTPMDKHCCLPCHFSAFKLISISFHIELIRIIMHAS